MKILFYVVGDEQMGVEYLMAYLKERGHDVDLILDYESSYLPVKLPEYTIQRKIERKIETFSPDIVAVSVNISTYPRAKKFINRYLSDKEVEVVVGGPHATSCPEFILRDIPQVDYVCIGEGEKPLSELANKLENNESLESIKGLAHLNEDKFVNNGPAELIEDLDELPHPRKEEFRKELGETEDLRLITGRGCPYSCSYCINSYYKKLYSNKYVRRRSIDSVINEIKYFNGKYDFQLVDFVDETFTYDRKWALEFLEKYSEEIKIPFHIYARPETLSEEMCEALERAGCESIFMGIDSGSERIRELHNRSMSNETIKKAAERLKKHSIEFCTSAIFGNPGETNQESWSTLKLIKEVSPDELSSFILFPLPKSEITEKLKGYDELSSLDMQKIKSQGKNLNSESFFRNNDYDYIFSRLTPIFNNSKLLRPLLRKILERENRRIAELLYQFNSFLKNKFYRKRLKKEVYKYMKSFLP